MNATQSAPARRRRLVVSAAACAVCLGLTAPLATAANVDVPVTVATDGQTSQFRSQGRADALTAVLGDDAGAGLIVLTPGTDDDDFYTRNASLVGDRASVRVVYPESMGPIIAGPTAGVPMSPLPFFAPSYDKSRDVAVANNLRIMHALKDHDGTVVYSGFSQGAEALGNAAESPEGRALLRQGDVILLVSDPRSPWGLKSFLSTLPGATPIMSAVGAENNGARDPRNMPDRGTAKVVSVIVVGDPAANFQWMPYRPVSSLAVNLAGFLTIHSDSGRYTYANLGELDRVGTFESVDGNTEYQVYDTYHPFALLHAKVLDTLGVPWDTEDLERWDRDAEEFYPTQAPSVATADKNAQVVEVPHPTGAKKAPAVLADSRTAAVAQRDVVVDDESADHHGDHTLTDDSGSVVTAPQSGDGRHRDDSDAAPATDTAPSAPSDTSEPGTSSTGGDRVTEPTASSEGDAGDTPAGD